MVFCPHCGQPYPVGQEFCRNCGADLRPAPAGQPPSAGQPAQSTPPVAPTPPVKKSHSLRNIGVAVVVVLVVFVAMAAVGYVYSLTGGSHPSRETWQQYGMSIQHPAGVKTQYLGVLDQQADSASGEAEWLWNGGNTGLYVVWVTTSGSYNTTAGLQGIYNELLSKASNVTILDQGDVTVAGHSWVFQIYRFTYNGQLGFATYAVAYYPSSGRAYALGFGDTSNTTFTSLESYASSFTG